MCRERRRTWENEEKESCKERERATCPLKEEEREGGGRTYSAVRRQSEEEHSRKLHPTTGRHQRKKDRDRPLGSLLSQEHLSKLEGKTEASHDSSTRREDRHGLTHRDIYVDSYAKVRHVHQAKEEGS